MRLKLITPFLAAAMLSVCAQAQTLLIDRGLPTANLNNAAGADRSNVAWSDATYLVGDSAQISSDTTLTKLRLWTIQSTTTAFDYFNPASYQLFTGVGPSDYSTTNLTATAAALTITSVTYSGGSTYETPSGFRPLLQLDFTLNLNVAAGEIFFFSLGGTSAFTPSLHASNAALSGSPQQEADDFIILWDKSDFSNWGGIQTGGSAWDKNSDINAQIWGTVVPEPSTYGMIGAAVLAGLVILRRRRA